MSPGMHVQIRNSTGTIAVLSSDVDPCFSFVPQDGTFGSDRGSPGYYALGDISMRIRYSGPTISMLQVQSHNFTDRQTSAL